MGLVNGILEAAPIDIGGLGFVPCDLELWF